MPPKKATKAPGAAEKRRRNSQTNTSGNIGHMAPGSQKPKPDLPVGHLPPAPEPSAAGFRERALGEQIRLPSGLGCRARRIGIDALVSGGKIPNMLLPIIQEALADKGSRQSAESKFKEQLSAEHLGEIMAMFDDITVHIVTAPPMYHAPQTCGCGAAKDIPGQEDVLQVSTDADHVHNWRTIPAELRPIEVNGVELAYVDWVDMEDKIFLFNFAVGGTRDIERFREEQAQSVADLSAG
jgi:hypothetical protein